MGIFRQKQWVNPIRKMSIFRRFELLIFIAYKGVFLLLNIVKTFSWPIMPKKKVEKMVIFGPKPWVNAFGKTSIFRIFQLPLQTDREDCAK